MIRIINIDTLILGSLYLHTHMTTVSSKKMLIWYCMVLVEHGFYQNMRVQSLGLINEKEEEEED